MIAPDITIIAICALVALCCALIGPFLILRRVALMSDAISHSIILGVIVGFLVFKTSSSLPLVLSSAAVGVLTVWLTELILKTGLVKEDASIGLVFPALFSIGVILITQFASDVHLDVDTVLVGEVILAPFDTVRIGGLSIARSLVTMVVILMACALFVGLFYKELKISTFDAALAAALGFMPGLLHYGLMTLLSVLAVGALDAVGAVLLVGFTVIPGAISYLLTDRLSRMILYSALIGVAASILGYGLSYLLNASVSGCIVVVLGLAFVVTLIFAPERGLLAGVLRRRRQRWEFAAQLLTVHLLTHEGTPDEANETSIPTLHDHLNWERAFADEVVARADQRGWIRRLGDQLRLTDHGRDTARAIRSALPI